MVVDKFLCFESKLSLMVMSWERLLRFWDRLCRSHLESFSAIGIPGFSWAFRASN